MYIPQTTELTRRLNQTGRGPVEDKHLLTKTHKMANDFSGEDVVNGEYVQEFAIVTLQPYISISREVGPMD